MRNRALVLVVGRSRRGPRRRREGTRCARQNFSRLESLAKQCGTACRIDGAARARERIVERLPQLWQWRKRDEAVIRSLVLSVRSLRH